jgi:hypothetical protein
MDIFIKDMLKELFTNLLKNALKYKKVITKVHVILGHPSYSIKPTEEMRLILYR